MLKKLFVKTWPYIKNKYVATLLAVLFWMLFLDRNDFMSQYSYSKQLKQLEEDKEYYQKEIETIKQDKEKLFKSPRTIEKFAREKYLMKKDNEDVFVIVNEE